MIKFGECDNKVNINISTVKISRIFFSVKLFFQNDKRVTILFKDATIEFSASMVNVNQRIQQVPVFVQARQC